MKRLFSGLVFVTSLLGTAHNQNFEVFSGNPKSLVFQITDDNNNNVNLTGFSITWILFDPSNNIKVTHSTGVGTIILSNQTTNPGQFTVTLSAGDTSGLSPGAYHHQVQAIDTMGNHEMLADGDINLLANLIGYCYDCQSYA